jgi:aryl-alcohol dehydrogenase-like predicted oxidoreductase
LANWAIPGPTPPVVTLLDTLEALTEFQRAGKIRYIGVSNETAFGVMRYLHLADKHDLPRIVTIQNPYSLLNRSFEVGLAEVASMKALSCWPTPAWRLAP